MAVRHTMTFTRRLLRDLARSLIGTLVLAQLAVAAYACPALARGAEGGQANSAAMALRTPMADCDDAVGAMDSGSPALCAEHCKQGQQSDQVPTLTVPAALLTVLYTTEPALPQRVPLRSAAATLSALVAASPPHTILHCVYRI